MRIVIAASDTGARQLVKSYRSIVLQLLSDFSSTHDLWLSGPYRQDAVMTLNE